MARTGISVRRRQPWSPKPSDARFSRRTPDSLLARINTRRDVDVTNGCKSSLWAPRILHNKARKLKRDNPRRAQLLSLLLKVAETAVAVPAAKELANTFASEACLNSVCEPETAVLFPKHSSVL